MPGSMWLSAPMDFVFLPVDNPWRKSKKNWSGQALIPARWSAVMSRRVNRSMALHFPYIRRTTRAPVLSLGGKWSRPKPIVAVTLIGPGGTRVRDGLLDTGADDTIFPASVAAGLGIDL